MLVRCPPDQRAGGARASPSAYTDALEAARAREHDVRVPRAGAQAQHTAVVVGTARIVYTWRLCDVGTFRQAAILTRSASD